MGLRFYSNSDTTIMTRNSSCDTSSIVIMIYWDIITIT